MIYGAAARMDIRKISLDHINFDVNELKNMLLPVLRGEDLKNTKNIRAWSNNLINTCKENLAEIITFNNNDLKFLTNIIEHGKIIPELITNDKTLINIINQHPVLLWKCIHVREYIKNDVSE